MTARLVDRLRDRIRREGPITVGDYMAAVLGDPAGGYYPRRDPLGAAGDFITAPEISQVFGELIGAWCIQTWRSMGAPGRFSLVELGPGRGTLMADALRVARADPAFLAAAEVQMVETSPTLRAAQRRALAGAQAAWHETFDDVPAGPSIVIANEFFDALPVEQYVRAADGWRRRRVGLDPATGAFAFGAAEAVEPPIAPPEPAPPGAVFETSPEALALAGRIASRVRTHGGAALIVDYGHARSAAGETLQAVSRHRYHHVLTDPGEADLTAHVDFEALGMAARAAGAAVFGPVTQGDFLTRLGIGLREERLAANATPDQAARLRSGCRRLVDPAQMGTLFKVLALAAPGLACPAGFEGGIATQ